MSQTLFELSTFQEDNLPLFAAAFNTTIKTAPHTAKDLRDIVDTFKGLAVEHNSLKILTALDAPDFSAVKISSKDLTISDTLITKIEREYERFFTTDDASSSSNSSFNSYYKTWKTLYENYSDISYPDNPGLALTLLKKSIGDDAKEITKLILRDRDTELNLIPSDLIKASITNDDAEISLMLLDITLENATLENYKDNAKFTFLSDVIKADSIEIFTALMQQPDYPDLLQKLQYSALYAAAQNDSAQIMEYIIEHHPKVLMLDRNGSYNIDSLVAVAASNDATNTLASLLSTDQYDYYKVNSGGKPQIVHLIYDAIDSDSDETALTLIEYANTSGSDRDLINLEDLLNYAIKQDAPEVLRAMIYSELMDEVLANWAQQDFTNGNIIEEIISSAQFASYTVRKLINIAINEDAPNSFKVILELDSKQTNHFQQQNRSLLQSITDDKAWKIADLVIEDEFVSSMLSPQQNILFQITVAIKNDDVEKLKILYENGKLTLDDMKDLMEDVIIHNATSILDSVHNFFTEVITHQSIYEKYTLIAARSNSIDIFNELLTNKPFNLTVKFTKHLLGAINANSADIALETLITNSGHTGNKLFSMALEKNLKFVVEKFLKNNYISALEDDSDLVLSLFDIPFKDNNHDMVKLMLSHFDYDIRDEDEVAFYNEILDFLTEKAIRSDSSNIFKIITQLREGFDINRPLNEDGQNALLIAFTNQTLGMFDYLMEEYYNTPELLSEAINFSDTEGMNLWHYAIKYCAPADIGALLENMLQAFGVECINNTNKNGNTPLILAMYEGYVDAAAFFLRHKADATLANKSGEKSMTKLSSGGLLETDSDYDGSDTDSEVYVSNDSTPAQIMSSKLLDDQGWFEASEDEEASSPYKLNVTALGTTDDELPVF